MEPKIVAILNYAPFYRKALYLKMEETLGCRFFFGDKTLAGGITKIPYNVFRFPVRELRFVRLIGNFNWLWGSIRLCFSDYNQYIFTGEPYCLSTWIMMAINKMLGKRNIVWTHGFYGNEYGLKKFLKLFFFKLSDTILLYGNYSAKIMEKIGFPADKIKVIYNSLDYDSQNRIYENLNKDDIYEKHFENLLPVVLFIGRLTRTKKLELLIEAQKISATEGQPFNVVIIGGGEDEQRLKELSKAHDAYFWYVGPLYDEATLGKFLYNADLCVSPGNVGLTAIHALTFGLPVISHDNYLAQMPEFEAITPGKTGMFFRENDSKDLYNKIIEFLENQSNRDETRTHCRKIISEFYNPLAQVKILNKLLF